MKKIQGELLWKNKRKYSGVILILISYFYILIANADLKDDMLPNANTIWVSWDGTGALTQVLVYTKNFLFSILGIVAVWVFLYFWFKLIINRWNEEEFKKALMWFLYAVIWLSIIPLAWWAVKIISTLKF